MVRPSPDLVHWPASGRGRPGAAPGAGPDGHGDVGRAGDGPGLQVDGEPVLGEAARDRRGRLALDAVADAGVVQLPDELAGAVGGIAVDGRLAVARGRVPG